MGTYQSMKTIEGSTKWWLSNFPEALWPVSCDHEIYRDKCILGKTKMANSSVLICGLARDCEDTLVKNIARIDRLKAFFKKSKVFVYENDSSDKTADILYDWWCEGNITLVTEDLNNIRHEQDHSHKRTVDMAYYRNKYLKFAAKEQWDFMIVYDFDLEGGFSYEGVCNSFGYDEWDVIGSNSLYYDNHSGQNRRLYYDSWAFREFNDEEYKDVNLKRYERGEAPIEVFSCFGGLAIYKRDCVRPEYQYKAGDCDHPTLHKQMRRDGYKVFLNPSQITLYNEHGYK